MKAAADGCDQKYVKEETLETAYAKVIGNVVLPFEFLDWAISVILEKKEEEQRFHLDAAGRLDDELARILKRLDAMYQDRLEDRISLEMYDRHADAMNREQTRLQRCIAEHRSSHPKSYATEGAQVLELAAKARQLFEMQPPRRKRKLLQIVVSNSTWENGKLSVEYR